MGRFPLLLIICPLTQNSKGSDFLSALIQELFDILDREYQDGGIDARAYASLKGALMCYRQRLLGENLIQAIDLYNAVKAVING